MRSITRTLVVALFALIALAPPAQAQGGFPSQPVKFLVPFPGVASTTCWRASSATSSGEVGSADRDR